MVRSVCCLAVVLAAWGAEAVQAAAPPSLKGDKFRSLSLREAVTLAREQVAGRVEGAPRLEAERIVNQMLLNVEVLYWNLYGAYWTLYSREQGLRLAFEAFQQTKASYEAGRAGKAELYQSRGQYELFRAQRLQALDQLLESERQLRALLGLPGEDGRRLIPSDSPTLAPSHPDWKAALKEALARRPELRLLRQEVLVQLAVLRQEVARAELGVPFDAAVPANLVRATEILRDNELKAQGYLANYYRRLSTNYEQIRANRAQREAFGEQLRARQQEFQAGRGTLDILLESQRFWADALANEYNQVAAYNNALAGFEYARGTIQQRNYVACARASEKAPSLPAVMAGTWAGCPACSAEELFSPAPTACAEEEE
jgi:outer membrane protein TolC